MAVGRADELHEIHGGAQDKAWPRRFCKTAAPEKRVLWCSAGVSTQEAGWLVTQLRITPCWSFVPVCCSAGKVCHVSHHARRISRRGVPQEAAGLLKERLCPSWWSHRMISVHGCSLAGASHHPSWCRQATRMLGEWDQDCPFGAPATTLRMINLPLKS